MSAQEGRNSSEAFFLQLNARQQIHDVHARYCRGADRCDGALMKSCYHDDAWDDHGFFKGPGADFVDVAVASLTERFIWTQHLMTNEYVELDGERAKSETYILCVMRMMREGQPFNVTASSRYLDRFERRNGVWKIAYRLLVSEGNQVTRIEEEYPRLNQGKPGARGKDDPFYLWFAKNET